MRFDQLDGGLSTLAEQFAVLDHRCVSNLNGAAPVPGALTHRGGSRRGNTTAAAGGKILGIHQWQKDDGTRTVLAKTGTILVSITFDASHVVTVGATILSGMTADFRPAFVNFGNKVLIFDSTKNYAYDGTNVTELGRDAPDETDITITPSNGAGSLTPSSTYNYKFTFYSTSLDLESTILLDILVHQPVHGRKERTQPRAELVVIKGSVAEDGHVRTQ